MSASQTRDELLDVLAARQRNLPLRVAIPLVIAATFTLLAGDMVHALWPWATVYTLSQAGEFLLTRRMLSDPAATLGRRARAMVVAVLAANSAVFTLGAVLLLATRLNLAPALSVLIAAGALLNSIVVSRRSLTAFLALNLPNFVWLFAMPLLMALREPSLVLAPAFAVGAALLCASATLAWLSLSQALRQASAAWTEAEARRAEAEAARDARAAFTAAVSHELRTPLSAIQAASAALAVRALTPETRESAVMIGEASRLMRRLLDDLLDFAKLEAGRMTVQAEAFDLHALVGDTARLWALEARGRGLELVVDGLDELPRHVAGDAMRLRQVLNNLMSNGLKFTARGEVRLELACGPEADGRRLVRLAVADTGAGLSSEALERLFLPFEQASASVAATHGGTGLGLAISRELARLMDGALTAEQRTDAPGARFVLELPLRVVAAPAEAADPVRDGSAARILVVDDHPLGRQAARVLLGLRGHDVRVCEDAVEALAVLAQTPFDLVLTDLTMEGVDGFGLARRLRAGDGPNRRAPLLALSGLAWGDVAAACAAAGIDGFVPKPLEPRQLYEAVDAALSRGPREAASLDVSAASSFSSHSQTISTDQPPAANAA